MQNDDIRLLIAVQLTRERIHTGTQPAAAAAFAPVLGLSAEHVRTLATVAEDACKQTRATLRAEQEACILRGEPEAKP